VGQDLEASDAKIVTVSPRLAAAVVRTRQSVLLPDPLFLFITGTNRIP